MFYYNPRRAAVGAAGGAGPSAGSSSAGGGLGGANSGPGGGADKDDRSDGSSAAAAASSSSGASSSSASASAASRSATASSAHAHNHSSPKWHERYSDFSGALTSYPLPFFFRMECRVQPVAVPPAVGPALARTQRKKKQPPAPLTPVSSAGLQDANSASPAPSTPVSSTPSVSVPASPAPDLAGGSNPSTPQRHMHRAAASRPSTAASSASAAVPPLPAAVILPVSAATSLSELACTASLLPQCVHHQPRAVAAAVAAVTSGAASANSSVSSVASSQAAAAAGSAGGTVPPTPTTASSAGNTGSVLLSANTTSAGSMQLPATLSVAASSADASSATHTAPSSAGTTLTAGAKLRPSSAMMDAATAQTTPIQALGTFLRLICITLPPFHDAGGSHRPNAGHSAADGGSAPPSSSAALAAPGDAARSRTRTSSHAAALAPSEAPPSVVPTTSLAQALSASRVLMSTATMYVPGPTANPRPSLTSLFTAPSAVASTPRAQPHTPSRTLTLEEVKRASDSDEADGADSEREEEEQKVASPEDEAGSGEGEGEGDGEAVGSASDSESEQRWRRMEAGDRVNSEAFGVAVRSPRHHPAQVRRTRELSGGAAWWAAQSSSNFASPNSTVSAPDILTSRAGAGAVVRRSSARSRSAAASAAAAASKQQLLLGGVLPVDHLAEPLRVLMHDLQCQLNALVMEEWLQSLLLQTTHPIDRSTIRRVREALSPGGVLPASSVTRLTVPLAFVPLPGDEAGGGGAPGVWGDPRRFAYNAARASEYARAQAAHLERARKLFAAELQRTEMLEEVTLEDEEVVYYLKRVSPVSGMVRSNSTSTSTSASTTAASAASSSSAAASSASASSSAAAAAASKPPLASKPSNLAALKAKAKPSAKAKASTRAAATAGAKGKASASSEESSSEEEEDDEEGSSEGSSSSSEEEEEEEEADDRTGGKKKATHTHAHSHVHSHAHSHSAPAPRRALPFWLLLSLRPDQQLEVVFHSSRVSAQDQTRLLAHLRTAIANMCTRVNQLCLLTHLHETKVASVLLLGPEGEESSANTRRYPPTATATASASASALGSASAATGSAASIRAFLFAPTPHHPPPAPLPWDGASSSDYIYDPNTVLATDPVTHEPAGVWVAGQLRPPLQLSLTIPLHERLKPEAALSGVVRRAFAPFATDRRDVYVYRDDTHSALLTRGSSAGEAVCFIKVWCRPIRPGAASSTAAAHAAADGSSSAPGSLSFPTSASSTSLSSAAGKTSLSAASPAHALAPSQAPVEIDVRLLSLAPSKLLHTKNKSSISSTASIPTPTAVPSTAAAPGSATDTSSLGGSIASVSSLAVGALYELVYDVYAVEPVGAAVRVHLFQVLRSRLISTTLTTLATALVRSFVPPPVYSSTAGASLGPAFCGPPALVCKLTPADHAFVRPPMSSPNQSLLFTLPPSIADPYLFLLYLKQHLLSCLSGMSVVYDPRERERERMRDAAWRAEEAMKRTAQLPSANAQQTMPAPATNVQSQYAAHLSSGVRVDLRSDEFCFLFNNAAGAGAGTGVAGAGAGGGAVGAGGAGPAGDAAAQNNPTAGPLRKALGKGLATVYLSLIDPNGVGPISSVVTCAKEPWRLALHAPTTTASSSPTASVIPAQRLPPVAGGVSSFTLSGARAPPLRQVLPKPQDSKEHGGSSSGCWNVLIEVWSAGPIAHEVLCTKLTLDVNQAAQEYGLESMLHAFRHRLVLAQSSARSSASAVGVAGALHAQASTTPPTAAAAAGSSTVRIGTPTPSPQPSNAGSGSPLLPSASPALASGSSSSGLSSFVSSATTPSRSIPASAPLSDASRPLPAAAPRLGYIPDSPPPFPSSVSSASASGAPSASTPQALLGRGTHPWSLGTGAGAGSGTGSGSGSQVHSSSTAAAANTSASYSSLHSLLSTLDSTLLSPLNAALTTALSLSSPLVHRITMPYALQPWVTDRVLQELQRVLTAWHPALKPAVVSAKPAHRYVRLPLCFSVGCFTHLLIACVCVCVCVCLCV
jgi:hypothetical protein